MHTNSFSLLVRNRNIIYFFLRKRIEKSLSKKVFFQKITILELAADAQSEKHGSKKPS